MKDVPNIQSQPVAGQKPCAAAPAQARAGAEPPIAFRALIERLRDQARALEETTDRPLSARDLSGAVQAAQASLHDALSIADGLVEAYRSNLVQGSGPPPGQGR
jgi:hypothetical protein